MEPSKGQARYEQVAEHLRARILSGELAAGSALPSEEETAARFDLSRPTVNKAYRALQAQGLVVIERGNGTFVRALDHRPAAVEQRVFTRDADGEYRDPEGDRWLPIEPPAVSRVDPTPEQADLLRIDVHMPLFREDLLCEERGTGRRQALRHLLPFSTIADTPLESVGYLRPPQLYRALAGLGHDLRWNERVCSRLPLPDEADALRIKPGVPLLLISRVTLTTDGRPLALTEARLPAADLELSYEITAAEPPKPKRSRRS